MLTSEPRRELHSPSFLLHLNPGVPLSEILPIPCATASSRRRLGPAQLGAQYLG